MSAHSRSVFRRAVLFSLAPLAMLAASSAAWADPVVTLANMNVSSFNYSTTLSQTSYRVANTGDIIVSHPANDANFLDAGDWLTPKTGMSNYQVRKTAGTCLGPPINQWIPLNTTPGPAWVTVAGGSPHASSWCWMTIEISAIAAPTVILASASISMSSSH